MKIIQKLSFANKEIQSTLSPHFQKVCFPNVSQFPPNPFIPPKHPFFLTPSNIRLAQTTETLAQHLLHSNTLLSNKNYLPNCYESGKSWQEL